MSDLSPGILRHGTDARPPECTELHAGPLSLLWQGAGVRRLRLGSVEILRRVYFAVRDRNWGTVPNVVSRAESRVEDARFELDFDVECVRDGIDFAWTGRITGEPDGSVVFRAEGEARSTFMANRIGFCVLHPIEECACRPCTVEHTDGTAEHGSFPYYVSPHQPFRDMRSISHQVAADLWAEVRFEGDAFEMEDQRNWTDASYKTYSRPLELPYPFEVCAGERFVQTVRLAFNGEAAEPAVQPAEAVITLGEEVKGILPAIGLSMPAHGRDLSGVEAGRLAALQPRHLRVDLDLREDGSPDLSRAARQAEALGCGLALAVMVDGNCRAQVEALADALAGIGTSVASCLLLHPAGPAASASLVPEARSVLSGSCPRARFGVGSNANFAELNRDFPPGDGLDFVSFAANPQVHAFDDMSILETPEGLGWAVRTARHLAGAVPVVVSPLTLKPRSRAVAKTGEQPAPDVLPPQVDPRQMSLLAAAWTVGCLKSLAESGADAVTLFETTGRRGTMETGDGPPMPGLLPAPPGCVFPVYHVLAALQGIAHGRVLAVESSRALDVQALAVEQLSGVRLLVANMTGEPGPVELRGLTSAARVKLLDERNAERAMCEPEEFASEPPRVVECPGGRLGLELLPYAVAVIDLLEDSDV